MAEGIATTLAGIADTRLVSADVDDLGELLQALMPDALVVDRDCGAADAHADEQSIPLFVVPVESPGGDVPSPERLRAAVVGSLLVGQVRG
jgi:hypothetical protein